MDFKNRLILNFYILLSVNIQTMCVISVSVTDRFHSKLLANIFDGYNRHVRPVLHPDDVTEFEFNFYIAHVLDMDERKQTLTTSTWLTLYWQDNYLIWDPSAYGNLTKVVVPAKKIWLPDVYFYESATQVHQHFLESEMAKISYDGKVMWSAPVIFKGYCLVQVKYFPFDKQQCQMKFGPWQHSGHELVINGSGSAEVFVSNGEWDMYGLKSVNNVEYYPDDPGVPYTDVTFTILFQRRSLYYVFHLITPCFLIAIMASLAFLLPPESQGKVTMGVTFLLSMTVFLMVVADAVPHTNEVPIIGQYFAITMVLVSLSLLMNVTVASLYYRGNEGRLLPTWAKVLTCKRVLTCLRIHTKHMNLNNDDDFSLGHAGYFRMKGQSYKSHNGYTHRSKENKFSEIHMTQLVAPTCDGVLQKDSTAHVSEISDEVRLMQDMLSEINLIREILSSKAGEESTTHGQNKKMIKNQWLLLSRVLDRIFFMSYVLGNMLALFLLFVGIYS